MTRSLRRRLSALDPGPLERLERDLTGATAADRPLRERLERLVTAASAKPAARAPTAPRAPLEELVQGLRVENERGEFFRLDHDLALETFHGEVPLSRFRVVSGSAVRVLAGEPGGRGFDLSRAAFLDTETTGLSGGAGTAAFLVGVGYVDGDRFRVRQYFMRDYHEEAALLRALARDLEAFGALVTFNGKMFDVPLLETRFRLNRDRFPLSEAPHLDLLHPARRLWKARLESCRLQSLEVSLLGLRRREDVPSEDIPRLYFDYVRRKDARALVRVFEHNRLDVVSLAALAVLACQWVTEDWAQDARDVLSLARVLERAEEHERAVAGYRRALGSEGPVRLEALLRLASRLRKTGDHARAAALWREAAEAGDVGSLRALAIHHEHRLRDPAGALCWVEQGLAREGPLPARALEDLRRRRARLLRKLAAGGGESAVSCC